MSAKVMPVFCERTEHSLLSVIIRLAFYSSTRVIHHDSVFCCCDNDNKF